MSDHDVSSPDETKNGHKNNVSDKDLCVTSRPLSPRSVSVTRIDSSKQMHRQHSLQQRREETQKCCVLPRRRLLCLDANGASHRKDDIGSNNKAVRHNGYLYPDGQDKKCSLRLAHDTIAGRQSPFGRLPDQHSPLPPRNEGSLSPDAISHPRSHKGAEVSSRFIFDATDEMLRSATYVSPGSAKSECEEGNAFGEALMKSTHVKIAEAVAATLQKYDSQYVRCRFPSARYRNQSYQNIDHTDPDDDDFEEDDINTSNGENGVKGKGKGKRKEALTAPFRSNRRTILNVLGSLWKREQQRLKKGKKSILGKWNRENKREEKRSKMTRQHASSKENAGGCDDWHDSINNASGDQEKEEGGVQTGQTLSGWPTPHRDTVHQQMQIGDAVNPYACDYAPPVCGDDDGGATYSLTRVGATSEISYDAANIDDSLYDVESVVDDKQFDCLVDYFLRRGTPKRHRKNRNSHRMLSRGSGALLNSLGKLLLPSNSCRSPSDGADDNDYDANHHQLCGEMETKCSGESPHDALAGSAGSSSDRGFSPPDDEDCSDSDVQETSSLGSISDTAHPQLLSDRLQQQQNTLKQKSKMRRKLVLFNNNNDGSNANTSSAVPLCGDCYADDDDCGDRDDEESVPQHWHGEEEEDAELDERTKVLQAFSDIKNSARAAYGAHGDRLIASPSGENKDRNNQGNSGGSNHESTRKLGHGKHNAQSALSLLFCHKNEDEQDVGNSDAAYVTIKHDPSALFIDCSDDLDEKSKYEEDDAPSPHQQRQQRRHLERLRQQKTEQVKRRRELRLTDVMVSRVTLGSEQEAEGEIMDGRLMDDRMETETGRQLRLHSSVHNNPPQAPSRRETERMLLKFFYEESRHQVDDQSCFDIGTHTIIARSRVPVSESNGSVFLVQHFYLSAFCDKERITKNRTTKGSITNSAHDNAGAAITFKIGVEKIVVFLEYPAVTTTSVSTKVAPCSVRIDLHDSNNIDVTVHDGHRGAASDVCDGNLHGSEKSAGLAITCDNINAVISGKPPVDSSGVALATHSRKVCTVVNREKTSTPPLPHLSQMSDASDAQKEWLSRMIVKCLPRALMVLSTQAASPPCPATPLCLSPTAVRISGAPSIRDRSPSMGGISLSGVFVAGSLNVPSPMERKSLPSSPSRSLRGHASPPTTTPRSPRESHTVRPFAVLSPTSSHINHLQDIVKLKVKLRPKVIMKPTVPDDDDVLARLYPSAPSSPRASSPIGFPTSPIGSPRATSFLRRETIAVQAITCMNKKKKTQSESSQPATPFFLSPAVKKFPRVDGGTDDTGISATLPSPKATLFQLDGVGVGKSSSSCDISSSALASAAIMPSDAESNQKQSTESLRQPQSSGKCESVKAKMGNEEVDYDAGDGVGRMMSYKRRGSKIQNMRTNALTQLVMPNPSRESTTTTAPGSGGGGEGGTADTHHPRPLVPAATLKKFQTNLAEDAGLFFTGTKSLSTTNSGTRSNQHSCDGIQAGLSTTDSDGGCAKAQPLTKSDSKVDVAHAVLLPPSTPKVQIQDTMSSKIIARVSALHKSVKNLAGGVKGGRGMDASGTNIESRTEDRSRTRYGRGQNAPGTAHSSLRAPSAATSRTRDSFLKNFVGRDVNAAGKNGERTQKSDLVASKNKNDQSTVVYSAGVAPESLSRTQLSERSQYQTTAESNANGHSSRAAEQGQQEQHRKIQPQRAMDVAQQLCYFLETNRKAQAEVGGITNAIKQYIKRKQDRNTDVSSDESHQQPLADESGHTKSVLTGLLTELTERYGPTRTTVPLPKNEKNGENSSAADAKIQPTSAACALVDFMQKQTEQCRGGAESRGAVRYSDNSKPANISERTFSDDKFSDRSYARSAFAHHCESSTVPSHAHTQVEQKYSPIWQKNTENLLNLVFDQEENFELGEEPIPPSAEFVQNPTAFTHEMDVYVKDTFGFHSNATRHNQSSADECDNNVNATHRIRDASVNQAASTNSLSFCNSASAELLNASCLMTYNTWNDRTHENGRGTTLENYCHQFGDDVYHLRDPNFSCSDLYGLDLTNGGGCESGKCCDCATFTRSQHGLSDDVLQHYKYAKLTESRGKDDFLATATSRLGSYKARQWRGYRYLFIARIQCLQLDQHYRRQIQNYLDELSCLPLFGAVGSGVRGDLAYDSDRSGCDDTKRFDNDSRQRDQCQLLVDKKYLSMIRSILIERLWALQHIRENNIARYQAAVTFATAETVSPCTNDRKQKDKTQCLDIPPQRGGNLAFHHRAAQLKNVIYEYIRLMQHATESDEHFECSDSVNNVAKRKNRSVLKPHPPILRESRRYVYHNVLDPYNANLHDAGSEQAWQAARENGLGQLRNRSRTGSTAYDYRRARQQASSWLVRGHKNTHISSHENTHHFHSVVEPRSPCPQPLHNSKHIANQNLNVRLPPLSCRASA